MQHGQPSGWENALTEAEAAVGHLTAAGKSSRFGGKEKKPFTQLGGRAVWLRSAELFWTRDDVSRVYVVISPEDRELFEMRFRAALVFANGSVVDGGAERFESVAN